MTRALYRPMTDPERFIIGALSNCSLPIYTMKKSFIRGMEGQAKQSNPQITDKQSRYCCQLVQHFRRQIPRDIQALAHTMEVKR